MASNRQQLTAVLARGVVPLLACLCCSWCTADPDVVFWTLAASDGTPSDGGGVVPDADGSTGEMSVDAAIAGWDSGSIPDLDGSFDRTDPRWCQPEELERLMSYLFPDGRCEQRLDFDGGVLDPSIYDGGSHVLVAGVEQCAETPLAWYPDDSERPSKLIACLPVCEGIKAGVRAGIRFGCEFPFGR